MNNATNGRLELVFEFHSAREFNEVSLHVGRQGLNQVTANFAVDKDNYLGKSIRMNATAGSSSSTIYNVTLDLKKRVGRFVRLQLDFNGPWLLLSEITFQSQSSDANATDPQDYNQSEEEEEEELVDHHQVADNINPSDQQGPEIALPDDNNNNEDSDIEEISTGKCNNNNSSLISD